jgi:ATP-dependent DNA helicase RecQ
MRDLRVDWNRIDEPREVSETHLNDVVNYATGKGCRQAYLLHYFGSSPSFGDQCGRCDSCLDEPISLPVDGRERSRQLPDDPQTVVRKILSGVARTRGYAGRIDMAAMLRGSPAERLAQEGYTQLSTFGLLDTMSQHDLVGAVRACEDAELIRSRNGARLELTDVGVEVMTGEVEVPRTLASRL